MAVVLSVLIGILLVFVAFQFFLLSRIFSNPGLLLAAKDWKICDTCGTYTKFAGPLWSSEKEGELGWHCQGCLVGHIVWGELERVLTPEQYRIVECAVEDRIEAYGKALLNEQIHTSNEANACTHDHSHNRGVSGHSGCGSCNN